MFKNKDTIGSLFIENSSIDSNESVRTVKLCTGCGKEKNLENFHKKGSRHDSRCKVCVSKNKKAANKKASQIRLKEAASQAFDQFTIFEQICESNANPAEIEMILRKVILEAA